MRAAVGSPRQRDAGHEDQHRDLPRHADAHRLPARAEPGAHVEPGPSVVEESRTVRRVAAESSPAG